MEKPLRIGGLTAAETKAKYPDRVHALDVDDTLFEEFAAVPHEQKLAAIRRAAIEHKKRSPSSPRRA